MSRSLFAAVKQTATLPSLSSTVLESGIMGTTRPDQESAYELSIDEKKD